MHMETFVHQPSAATQRARATILVSTVTTDFDQFYRRELPAMIGLARSICGDHQLAEDIAQEAMTKAHRNWSKVRGYDRPGAWLRRVTINLTLSRRRRVVRELSALTRIADDRTPVIVDTDPDAAVWEAVRELPPKQRAAIALFYQEDRSTASIAEILGCSVSTGTSHLNHARKRLAQLLDETTPEDLA